MNPNTKNYYISEPLFTIFLISNRMSNWFIDNRGVLYTQGRESDECYETIKYLSNIVEEHKNNKKTEPPNNKILNIIFRRITSLDKDGKYPIPKNCIKKQNENNVYLFIFVVDPNAVNDYEEYLDYDTTPKYYLTVSNLYKYVKLGQKIKDLKNFITANFPTEERKNYLNNLPKESRNNSPQMSDQGITICDYIDKVISELSSL